MPKGIPNNGINKGWFKKGTGFWSGKKRSRETIKKMSLSLKGRASWNKGITGYNLPKRHNPKEKMAYHWLGENVGYSGIHRWLEITYGKANKCESSFIGLKCKGISKKFNWAKLRDREYERKRGNFIQLCASCHLYYDFNEERREKLRQSHLGKKRV